MKKVVISQHRLLHYRVGLFESLRTACQDAGVDLRLVHGQPTRREVIKNDIGRLAWADQVRNLYLPVAGRDIVWQPFPKHLVDADLVILMQENRLVSNYPWIYGSRGKSTRVAFWGHGRNFQSKSPSGLAERWKRSYLGKVDWWFAYTELTRDVLVESGYPRDRVTNLNNSIDNGAFQKDLSNVSEEALSRARETLGIPESAPVGIFCGSLYPEKRIDYLIGALDAIRKSAPDFHMIVVGTGPSAAEVEAAAQVRPWLHCVGVRRGVEKATFFKLADLVLNPGLVGLHVLDAFCAGIPMITTMDAPHSPEIAYLQDDLNGLVCEGSMQEYAELVVDLISDPSRLNRLKHGAESSAGLYTLDNMVQNFVTGIEQCLSKPKKASR